MCGCIDIYPTQAAFFAHATDGSENLFAFVSRLNLKINETSEKKLNREKIK